jgi:cytochrome P450
MMRDPRRFQDPSEFRPQRFLTTNGDLSADAVKTVDPVFGFGRRYVYFTFKVAHPH